MCAASDIWSVGCTVIELLTCVPPYYKLQTMTALYRIVQDENPPIPDGLSADMSDFLRLCFNKDARQRPDAKMLLSHPWILNYRRTLQPALSGSDSIRIEKELGLTHEKTFICSVKIETAEVVLHMKGEEKSSKRHAENSAASLMIHSLVESNYV